VAALTVDTTWQWVLAPSETRGAEVHRRFWRQLVLWLAGHDGRPQADLWVMTDRPRYVLSDPDRPPLAEVTAHVRGSAAAPILEMKGPDGAALAVQLSADGGDWRAIVPLAAAGEYVVKAEAMVAAAPKQAETKFVVEEQDFETANILADAENLGRIARAGGGALRPIDRLGDLLTELATSLTPQAVAVEMRLPLGSGRVFLAIVLALLSAEWVLRRRWGLT
jgi:hypothetical protein